MAGFVEENANILFLVIEAAVLYLFHSTIGVGTGNLHESDTLSLVATLVYVILLLWGVSVGNTVIINSLYRKDNLANPTFARKYPSLIFIVHFLVCNLHTLVLGPLFLMCRLRMWYWTSFVAMLFGSLPIVPFNYNPESFGSAVGRFVVFRNIFELSLSLYLAVTLGDSDEDMALLSAYHYWIWAYRLLDVGPRRFMRSLLLPSKQMLVVLIVIYIVVPYAIMKDLIIFARTVPKNETVVEESAIMAAGRILYAFVCYMVFWILSRKYVEEVATLASNDGFQLRPDPKFFYDERVAEGKGDGDKKND